METFTLASIRVNKQMSVEEMAEAMDCTVDRWRRLETGETKMLATELIRFHKITGIDYESINLNPVKNS